MEELQDEVKATNEKDPSVEDAMQEKELEEVIERYKNGTVNIEDEENEDRKVVGHRAEATWVEKNIPRTRKLRNTFHKNQEVAENMAMKTILDYFEGQEKEGIKEEDVNIRLYPIYEE